MVAGGRCGQSRAPRSDCGQHNDGDVRSFVRSFVPKFVRWFRSSFVRSFVRSEVRSFVSKFVRSFVCSFVRSFVRSLIAFSLWLTLIVNAFEASVVHGPPASH